MILWIFLFIFAFLCSSLLLVIEVNIFCNVPFSLQLTLRRRVRQRLNLMKRLLGEMPLHQCTSFVAIFRFFRKQYLGEKKSLSSLWQDRLKPQFTGKVFINNHISQHLLTAEYLLCFHKPVCVQPTPVQSVYSAEP